MPSCSRLPAAAAAASRRACLFRSNSPALMPLPAGIAMAMALLAATACPAMAHQPVMDSAAVAPAHDASADDAALLDAVVVVGEREPGNFDIDREAIELAQADDLGDVLAYQSGVAVGGGAPVGQKVYVRGFEDTLLNVTIDGAAQPAELYHHQARVQVEPEFIKSIELDAGAGAATAGPGALTGAMRVSTRDAFDMLAVHSDPDRRAGLLIKGAAGFSGEDRHKAVAAVYGRLSDRVAALASWVWQDGGDYDDGHGERVTPTAFVHRRGQARLTGRFDAHTADLSFEHLEDTGTYYERPHMINFAGRFVLSDHEMTRRTTSYRHRYQPGSDLVDVEATAYRNTSAYQNRRNTTGLLYGRGEQTSTGLDLRNTARWQSLDLVYGIDARHDRLQARQQATPPAFWADTRQSARVLGTYAQATWTPSEAWRASAGLRWDDYHHRVDRGPGAGATNDGSRLSPNASLEWRPMSALTLRAAYARAFRGVTLREGFFSALYVHHGDLRGESADNLELGAAFDHAGWFARATAYRQRIDNYINAVYTGDTSPEWGRWANVGRAEVEGFEIEAGRRWRDVDIGLGVWDADNRFEGRTLNDADLGLGTSIGRTWIARVDWQPSSRARYGLRARRVQDEPNAIVPGAPDKPGYQVTDAMAEWGLDAAERWRLGLAVDNLFDSFHYDHGSYGYHPSGRYIGFAEPGRMLRLSISLRL